MQLKPDTDAQFASERARRLRDELASDNRVSAHFVALVETSFSGAMRSGILSALQFATSIDYHHQGLTSQAYLNHPLRVATYALEELGAHDPDTVITALLHNVLEVSHVTAAELADRFGATVSDSIVRLTVDRSRQSNQEYKQGYYAGINDGVKGARQVKILDKFDNIFLICFNPSDAVRKDYLEEIETFVLPMAQRDLPGLATYLATLTSTMKTFGYLDKKTEISKISQMGL